MKDHYALTKYCIHVMGTDVLLEILNVNMANHLQTEMDAIVPKVLKDFIAILKNVFMVRKDAQSRRNIAWGKHANARKVGMACFVILNQSRHRRHPRHHHHLNYVVVKYGHVYTMVHFLIRRVNANARHLFLAKLVKNAMQKKYNFQTNFSQWMR